MSRSSWLFNPENDGQRAFKERFDGFVKQRENFIDNEVLSVPSGKGILLIIASGRPSKASPVLPQEQIKGFQEEADRLAHERRGWHADVQVVKQAKPRELQIVFANPDISDIIFIGHGNIARIWTEKRGDFSWVNVANAATHLKTGKIEQRMCGHLGETGAVPLGTFAVRHLENITAAVGISQVPDVNPPNDMFVPVFEAGSSEPLIEQIRQLNLNNLSNH